MGIVEKMRADQERLDSLMSQIRWFEANGRTPEMIETSKLFADYERLKPIFDAFSVYFAVLQSEWDRICEENRTCTKEVLDRHFKS